MRTGLLLALMMVAAMAGAGTLEKCKSAEKTPDDIHSCIEIERSRSVNNLRDFDPEARAALNRKTPAALRNALLQEYQAAQAQHVRKRSATCGKKKAGDAQLACEADMNAAHLEQLVRFTK